MDYAALAVTASRMIAKFGRAVTLRRKGSAVGYSYSFDPVLGDTWTLIASPYTVTHTDPGEVALSYAAYAVEYPYEIKDRDGTLVMEQDRRFLLEVGSGVLPLFSDLFIVGTDTLSIVNIKPLAPGGTPVLFEVQCRG